MIIKQNIYFNKTCFELLTKNKSLQVKKNYMNNFRFCINTKYY